MIKKLVPVLTGALPPGLYRFTSRAQATTLQHQVEAAGWRAFHLEGDHMGDKTTFLQASAAAMHFPAYFGANWDAFEESINDLAWAPAPGYVILFDGVAQFANQAPDAWSTAYDILQGAVTQWQQHGVPLFILLRGTGLLLRELPQL
jgi:hypothetical protein